MHHFLLWCLRRIQIANLFERMNIVCGGFFFLLCFFFCARFVENYYYHQPNGLQLIGLAGLCGCWRHQRQSFQCMHLSASIQHLCTIFSIQSKKKTEKKEKKEKKAPNETLCRIFTELTPFKFIQDEQQTKLIEIIIYGLNNNCWFFVLACACCGLSEINLRFNESAEWNVWEEKYLFRKRTFAILFNIYSYLWPLHTFHLRSAFESMLWFLKRFEFSNNKATTTKKREENHIFHLSKWEYEQKKKTATVNLRLTSIEREFPL